MTRMVFKSVANLTEDPVEVFWLAGFVCNERNEWQVRVVYRNKRTGELIPMCEPIGMLPILSLGTWFDYGLLQTEGLPGDLMEVVIPDVGQPEVITSADMPSSLYRLPASRAGHQRLFRYRTRHGVVHIPAAELIRALFIHNRALALALMRPAGLEQLYIPMASGPRELATLCFTKEIAKSVLSRELAMEFAWLVLDVEARRSWESVRCLSAGQDCIFFEPPPIRGSSWQFRGIRHGNQMLVLELNNLSGRAVPVKILEYTHPDLKKAIRARVSGAKPGNPKGGDKPDTGEPGDDIDVAGTDQGSSGYRNPLVANMGRRQSAFESQIKVIKKEIEVEHAPREPTGKEPKKKPRHKKKIQVTTSERAGGKGLRPIDFGILCRAPLHRIGDLVAFDETIRHMRDRLPDVQFAAGLVLLKQGRAAASVGSAPRAAMVVRINRLKEPPIVLIDIDRTGIVALSLMVLHFKRGEKEDWIERAIQKTLNGWADVGGHWSTDVEAEMEPLCRSERIPKAMVPREGFEKQAEGWALRLIDRLGL
ncbi:hypothetical protein [Stenotrophomonas sp. SY1]|uniref:hypothetical protein n=1 Tax=Stenotrophomonas sp. SY1 TaxID=477235 RepID=UPI001E4F56BE|nr:hypothetical protein [Stenotrophomonas sp. SY1]MCD9085821.1 hypothetical protein [Stenotrophomonas sp. SY1]